VGALSGVTVDELGWYPVDDAGGAGVVRRVAVDAADRLGFAGERLGELTIVVQEMASNLHKHADNGRLAVRVLRTADGGGGGGIELVAIDSGPGMADPLLSGRDGHSTAGTLGIGLGAVARLSTSVDGYSLPGKGTVLTVQVWPADPPPVPALRVEGLSRPMTGEKVCGDRFAIRPIEQGVLVLLADGLGHGPFAATAASAAADAFLTSGLEGPAAIIEQLHKTISYTRGAAVSVARITAGAVLFAGLGNVAGWVASPDGTRKGMVSMPGIVGHQARSVREFSYPVAADAAVVMHSDGVSDRWSLGDYPGLARRTPLTIAATLLRDGGQRRDDACLAVAKPATPTAAEPVASG
jgi:anti-sigma regulatory factor (Ser/Thr protein kinase)